MTTKHAAALRAIGMHLTAARSNLAAPSEPWPGYKADLPAIIAELETSAALLLADSDADNASGQPRLARTTKEDTMKKTVSTTKARPPEYGGATGSVPPRRNPVRVLNDALHEYRTQHTTMSKDEFHERGCYDAFMWAWQHSAQNVSGEAQTTAGGNAR